MHQSPRSHMFIAHDSRSSQSVEANLPGSTAASTIATGRLLAHVRCNGTDAGAEQVRRGLAWVFERYAPARSPRYAVEAEARAARRGVMGYAGAIAPWEWRQH